MIKMVFDCIKCGVSFLLIVYIIHQINCIRKEFCELLDNLNDIDDGIALNHDIIESILNVLVGNPNTKTEKQIPEIPEKPEKHMSYCCGNCKYFYRKADGGLVSSYCRKGVNDICPYDICDWYESYI